MLSPINDSILKTEKAVEDARKEELESRLDDFRRQQSEANKSGGGEDGDQDTAAWAAGKKRRRKEVGSKGLGVKVRRKSSTTGEKPLDKDRGEGEEDSLVLKPKEEEKKAGGKDRVGSHPKSAEKGLTANSEVNEVLWSERRMSTVVTGRF
ncbi:hypothetical protein B9Z19DRAFT_1131491 [Tuber borchii]|uniref:Uncharacterized protein n=1 Tax=Tuber borchii TaxID=42251 RepID=A0A2T6ZIN8_TUBBO|nr:hypothetical protein B9Z19DRAFT_1131491 [Tuber borchii]